MDGYNAADYFDGSYRYAGHDCHGVEPIFAAVVELAPAIANMMETIRCNAQGIDFIVGSRDTKRLREVAEEWVEAMGGYADLGGAASKWLDAGAFTADGAGEMGSAGLSAADVEADCPSLPGYSFAYAYCNGGMTMEALVAGIGKNLYVVSTDGFSSDRFVADDLDEAIGEAFSGEGLGIKNLPSLESKFPKYVEDGAWCWIEEDGERVVEIGKCGTV